MEVTLLSGRRGNAFAPGGLNSWLIVTSLRASCIECLGVVGNLLALRALIVKRVGAGTVSSLSHGSDWP
jgi:hypothetical protein